MDQKDVCKSSDRYGRCFQGEKLGQGSFLVSRHFTTSVSDANFFSAKRTVVK